MWEKVFKIWLALALGSLIGFGLATWAHSATLPTDQVGWCQVWNTMGDQDEPNMTESHRFMWHLGFFLTKSDQIRVFYDKNIPASPTHDKQVAAATKCYEEETPDLIQTLDQVCSKEGLPSVTAHDALLDYIVHCMKQGLSVNTKGL